MNKPPAPNRADAIQDVLQTLHATGAHSDFVLMVGDKEWKVHKMVLMMHSDVLYKMSTNENFVESMTGRAVLKEVEAEQIDAMVHFMYHGEYCTPDGTPASLQPGTIRPEGVKFHVSMVALSDRYNVPSLHQFALDCAGAGVVADNVVEVARHLYDLIETPNVIRMEIVRLIANDLKHLLKNGLRSLLDEMPYLAVDVLLVHGQRDCGMHDDDSDY